LDYNPGQNRMITGFYSKHDNKREDRRWKFYSGYASGVVCSTRSWTDWVNWWDDTMSFECAGNEALQRIYSYHDNKREDRRWKFKCCRVSSNAHLISGGWTDYKNDWDSKLDYECPNSNTVVVGIKSYHDNKKEDRRWKFKCAELLKN